MGTDIHAYLETRKGPDQPWEKVGAIFPYPYYQPERPTELRKYGTPGDEDYEEYWSNPEFCDHPYMDLNYTLFAVLAGVRNGFGFAGLPIGNELIPIAEPRGMPEDASVEMTAIWEREGDHTPSWLLVQEMLDYDWNQPYIFIGVITEEQFKNLRAGVKPKMWSGDVSGAGIVVYTAHEYEAYEANNNFPTHQENKWTRVFEPITKVYVRTAWNADDGLRGAIGKEWFRVLGGLADGYDPLNTRLVFWFDS